MRKNIVVGNWKMHNDLAEGRQLVQEILTQATGDEPSQIVLGVPFIHLSDVANQLTGKKNIEVSAQNCSHKAFGAYTGEVSASMVKSTGASYVILGHSERREYFQETNEALAAKVDLALSNDLIPIFCCGEPLAIRESETHFDYVKKQLTESIFHLRNEDFANIVIAYEPIWAIGTGKTASATQAQDMHATLRDHLVSHFGHHLANNCSILYGGSAKPANAIALFAGADVDGGLIGGASLNATDFLAVVNSF